LKEPKEKTLKPQKPNQDFDFDFQLVVCPLIPEGGYEVGYVRAEKKLMWGREKLFLWFQITTPGEYHSEQLYLACNLPTGKKLSQSSKLGRAWVLALGQKTDRFDRFSPKVFQGKRFRAKVRTVTQSSKQSKLRPEQQYSIIDELTEKVIG